MYKIKCVWVFSLLSVLVVPLLSCAKDEGSVKLPPPRMKGGKPLMEVLRERKTVRSFTSKDLSEQELSDLLWAAFGINRSAEYKRTAPSAMNRQETDIYVAKKDGLYIYEAKQNVLRKILDEDIRGVTGEQDFVKDAPINLIYVADYSKMGNLSKENKDFYSAADVGFIAQNVYLFCASEGLATVVRGWIDKEKLHKTIKLKESQKIILAQTVGYPKN